MFLRFIAKTIAAICLASVLTACERLVPGARVAAPPPGARMQTGAAPAAEQRVPRPVDAPTAPASADLLSDAVITARIKASLITDPAMAGADVSVNADRGVVNLTGSVATQEQSAIASAHAQRPDGVMRIDNHLSVAAR